MRQAAYIYMCCLFALGGCAHQAPLPDVDVNALAKCPAPDSDGSSIGIAASVLPIQLPAQLRPAGTEAGTLARRVVVTFARGSLRPGTSLLWTRLSLRTFGGTVVGWTRVESDGVLVDVASPANTVKKGHAHKAGQEVAAIEAGPGYIVVDRTSRSSRGVASALSVDVLVVPGGARIDEPALRVHQLWNKEGRPLPREALKIDLVPLRHAPGYDTLDADVELDFVAISRRGDAGGAVPCVSSAQTRTTLVDKESVRPALWDLGVSSPNGPRTRWLALSSPEAGVVRAVFESQEAATAFANWIRATQSLDVGAYRLGLFQRAGRTPLRPLVPVDLSSTETFRPLTLDDARALRVGPLGEP